MKPIELLAIAEKYWLIDHYRPWMEANVGKQKIDWDWGFIGNDVNENCLTIKIRQTKAKYATMIVLNWT